MFVCFFGLDIREVRQCKLISLFNNNKGKDFGQKPRLKKKNFYYSVIFKSFNNTPYFFTICLL